MVTDNKNEERVNEHVLKAWVNKTNEERQSLMESCEGMDELFLDLGGDDCSIDYYAFLFLAEMVRHNIRTRHIDQSYKYAELWSKWDLENQEDPEHHTASMSSYDSFYYYMDNGLYDTEKSITNNI
jgi:hypothetical protein